MVPPRVEVPAVLPLIPEVWSQATKAILAIPWKPVLGTKRILVLGFAARSRALELPVTAMGDQVEPLLMVYCHVPLAVPVSPLMAMPKRALGLGSVMPLGPMRAMMSLMSVPGLLAFGTFIGMASRVEALETVKIGAELMTKREPYS